LFLIPNYIHPYFIWNFWSRVSFHFDQINLNLFKTDLNKSKILLFIWARPTFPFPGVAGRILGWARMPGRGPAGLPAGRVWQAAWPSAAGRGPNAKPITVRRFLSFLIILNPRNCSNF
jgi:hypothetical protein